MVIAATNGQQAPVLWGPDGKPLSVAGAMVAPNALNFAQLLQLPGRLYSFRWDEAMRDNPQNALGMKRDAFYLALLQERWAPTINLDWQCEVDNEDDPKQKLVRDSLNRVWRDTPDRSNLIAWLLWAEWYGRSAQQGMWGVQDTGLKGWTHHEPINGDSIQYTWDGTPVVLVGYFTAQKYMSLDPAAVIAMSDRGAYGIKLYKPSYRRRFVIHKFSREAADYFEGEMAGGIHGVGLRSWVYWAGWMRVEVLGWMLSFMQSTGMMDLLIFNYADGNTSALAAQTANAKKISGKLVLLVPRDPKEKFAAVEQVQMNTAGVEVLKNLIESYYDRWIERLIVGQSMSAGGGASGGLEGSGRAEFAQDTKYQLCKMGANRLGESLTRDYITPAKEFNFPWADFPVRLVPILRDPGDERKVENGVKLIRAGVEISVDELRKAGGYRAPKPGEETVGKAPAPMPGGMPGSPGDDDFGDPPNPADLMHRLRSLEQLILYRATSPPWDGAVFDERAHRWKNHEDVGDKGKAARPQAGAVPHAKQLADIIQAFGEKAVEAARSVGKKANELSYRVLAFCVAKGIDPNSLWEPSDETSLFSNRAALEASAAALGIPLSGPVVKAISTIWGYGVSKLKQFVAQRAGERGKEGYAFNLFPELYAADSAKPSPEVLTLWGEIAGELLAAAGIEIPPEAIAEWLSAQGRGERDSGSTDYAFDEADHPRAEDGKFGEGGGGGGGDGDGKSKPAKTFTGVLRDRRGVTHHFVNGRRVADDDDEGKKKSRANAGSGFASSKVGGDAIPRKAGDALLHAHRSILSKVGKGETTQEQAREAASKATDSALSLLHSGVKRRIAALRADVAHVYGEDSLDSDEWSRVEWVADLWRDAAHDAVQGLHDATLEAIAAVASGGSPAKSMEDMRDWSEAVAKSGHHMLAGLVTEMGKFKEKYKPKDRGDDAASYESIESKLLNVMDWATEYAFDESKHPRAEDGKFGEGGGNEKVKANPDAKTKVSKRPKWAASAEIGGALDQYEAATGKAKEFIANAFERAGLFEYDEKTDSVKPVKNPYKDREPEDVHAELVNGLAAAYRDIGGDAHIAAALEHMGAEQIGEADAGESFDGSLHDGPTGTFTGHAVKIVRPGWVIGNHVILKATVEKA